MSLSIIILPIFILVIIIYGVIKKVPVYDTFIDGAKEGFKTCIEIFPYTLAMLVGIGIFVKSNFLIDTLGKFEWLFRLIKIPVEIIPIAIMRPISGGASLGLLNDIFTNFGPDSFLGRLASTIQGSTDTTIYIITLYFGSVGIKKIKYAMWVGLFADLIGIIASIIIVSLVFP